MIAGTSQRREPHRRARRAGHRRLGDGVRARTCSSASGSSARTASRQRRARKCYEVRDPLDLAVVAAAVHGRLLRLPVVERVARPRSSWATPARWPSAARSPGSPSSPAPSCCCVILGGLFVVITLSVIIQVGSFKLTGKRVFRMAPLQHHFELLGLGRGHDRHPVLDHRRAVRRARPRALLRRVGRGRRMTGRLATLTDRDADWAGLRVRASPASGVTGFAAADALLERGARGHRRRRRATADGARRAGADPATSSAPTCGSARTPVRAARRRRPGRHLAGLAPRPAAARGGRRGRHPGLGRGRARLAAAAARGARRRGSRSPAPTARPRPCGCSTSILRAAGLRAVARRQRRAPRARGRAAPRAATTCSPSSCRASSCTGPHSLAPQAAAVLNVAPDHVDWHGSLDGVRRGQGPGLRAHRGRLRLQRRRPAHRAAGARTPTSSRAAARSASPSARRRRRHARRGRRRAGRPRLRRAAPHRARPSWRRSTTCAATRPTAGAAPRRQRARGRRAGPRARRRRRPRSATGCARFAPERAPHRRASATVDGVALRRRLQGDQPARRRRVAWPRTTHVVWVAGGLAKGADVRRPGRRRRRPAARRRADRRATGR